jgi:hypothetical protein
MVIGRRLATLADLSTINARLGRHAPPLPSVVCATGDPWVVHECGSVRYAMVALCMSGDHSGHGPPIRIGGHPAPDVGSDSGRIGRGLRGLRGTQSRVYTATYDVGNTTWFVLDEAIPGQGYYVAVAAYAPGLLVGPLSPEVAGFSNASPALINPGDQTSPVGQPVELQLIGSDPSGQPVTYSFRNRPPAWPRNPREHRLHFGDAAQCRNPDRSRHRVRRCLGGRTHILLDNDPCCPRPHPADRDHYHASRLPQLHDGRCVRPVGGYRDRRRPGIALRWSNDRGGSGAATGTSSWVAGVLLRSGRNNITIMATDGAGNTGAAVISVYGQSPVE